MATKQTQRGKFQNAILERLYQGIEMGMPYAHACLYAGISEDTFENWRNGAFPRGVTAAEKEEFHTKLGAAEGRAVATKFGIILRAANGDPDRGVTSDWRAATWLLERRYPDIYGKVSMEHSTRNNEPLKMEVDVTTKEQKLAELLDSLPAEMLGMIDEFVDRLEEIDGNAA